MFVRGELTDVNKLMIDIGTGYYVEKVRVSPVIKLI